MRSWGRDRGLDEHGSGPHKLLHRAGLGMVSLVALLATSCGDDSGATDAGSQDEGAAADATTTTALPACEDRPMVVVFHINGVLTPDREEFTRWLDDPEYVMEVRTGAVELASAYHERGFNLMYSTRGGDDLDIHGTPYPEAISDWLSAQGFPLDDRAYLHEATDTLSLADAMTEAQTDGGGGYAAYTNVGDDVPALQVAGVPEERIYGMDDLAGEEGTTAVPGDNFEEHQSMVEGLEPVCVVA